MALRKLRIEGDPILRKVSKEVKNIDERTLKLLDDMAETMYQENGVGLAAPQVGSLRRMIVVDVGEGLYKMINPKIIDQGGSDIDIEGCLSVPNFNGTVERPQWIEFQYTDENGQDISMKVEDLFARCVCHEIDHLNGILFRDKYIDEITQEDLVSMREDKNDNLEKEDAE